MKWNGVTRTAAKVGAIAAAMIAVGSIVAWVNATVLTRPIVEATDAVKTNLTALIAEERASRVMADTLIVQKLDLVIRGQDVILDVARDGLYSRREINDMREEDAAVHDSLWRATGRRGGGTR